MRGAGLKLILARRAGGAAPPEPPLEALGPSPQWYANGGVGGAGFTTLPDPTAMEAARLAVGGRPAPAVNLMFPDERIQMDVMWLPFEVVLHDTREGSPSLGKPVPCSLTVMNEGNEAVIPVRTTRFWVDTWGVVHSESQHWVPIAMPMDHLGPQMGGPGASTHIYVKATPNDLTNYMERIAGPFIFFPRDASGVVIKKIHKTAQAGVDHTSMLAFYNNAPNEYANTGRAVIGEVVDDGKDWALGRATKSAVIPWGTEIRPGADLTTGLLCRYTLGDKAEFPEMGYSSPGINKLFFIGCKHDEGATGGIVARDATTNHMVLIDHETFCSSFPATANIKLGTVTTPYAEYGTGSGVSALVRGRGPSYAYIPNAQSAPKFVSVNGYWHDLPSNALIYFTTSMHDTIDGCSGTPIQDHRGAVVGAKVRRFGGFYSGLCTRPGDRNPGMSLTPISGAAYSAYEKNGNVGSQVRTSPNQALTSQWILYVGADEATATATAFDTVNFRSVAELVALINATGQWLAVDLTTPAARLDCTHLSREGLSQSAAIPKTQVSTTQNFHVLMDIHASGFSLNVTSGMRKNVSMRNSTFRDYCGAGTISCSSPNALTYVDLYFEGCVYRDDQQYTDRQGAVQEVGIELGYATGYKDGFGIVNCTFASKSGTSGSGVQFGGGVDPYLPHKNCVVGFSYGQFGNPPPSGMKQTGIVSPYQSLPSGATNSKALGSVGVSFPDTSVFRDPVGGDYVPANANALLPDGVNWAGAYDGTTGVRKAA